MSEAREKIEAYNKARKELYDILGLDGHYKIFDYLDAKWIVIRDKAGTGEKYMSYIDKGCEFSFDYVSLVESDVDDLIVFYVQERGDIFYAIMDRSNQMTREEAQKAGVL